MKIEFIFAWYDFWIGIFYDRKKQWLYILPLPMIGIIIKLKPKQRLEAGQHETIVNCTYQKKDDKLIEILTPLGTDIDDPTGEYTDLFAYLYDNISPLLRQ